MEKKIDRFEFANLRQFKGKYKITFDDKLNLITGNNGSGKSTVIEGINAVLGKEIDNAESLINKSKIAAHIKVIFDDDTSVMLKLLKEDDKIRKMYFINNRYTTQGAAIGTVLVFMMAIVALSLPEMIIFSRVMKKELITRFVIFMFIVFTLVGYFYNLTL